MRHGPGVLPADPLASHAAHPRSMIPRRRRRADLTSGILGQMTYQPTGGKPRSAGYLGLFVTS